MLLNEIVQNTAGVGLRRDVQPVVALKEDVDMIYIQLHTAIRNSHGDWYCGV